MRILFLTCVAAILSVAGLVAPVQAQQCPEGKLLMPMSDSLYGLGGSGQQFWTCVEPVFNLGGGSSGASGTSSPNNSEPFDFSGITLIMDEPDQLITSSLDSGKAYQVAIAKGQSLSVFDRPWGSVVGAVSSQSREIRGKYIYVADVHQIWLGICERDGVCGWASADNLFSLPSGTVAYDIFRVVQPEVYVTKKPGKGAAQLGRIFRDNRVAVIGHQVVNSQYWMNVCRLQSCGWVPESAITFERGM